LIIRHDKSNQTNLQAWFTAAQSASTITPCSLIFDNRFLSVLFQVIKNQQQVYHYNLLALVLQANSIIFRLNQNNSLFINTETSTPLMYCLVSFVFD
jgi:hypothetical protein